MKKIYLSPLHVLLLIGLFSSSSIHAQEPLYFEDFSQGIPEDFRIVDVDGLTITPALDSNAIQQFPFNGSWVLQINFENPEDTVMGSASWYDPAGVSDDWLITGSISIPDTGAYYLQWRAQALDPDFADGYEVYISTTGNTVGDFTTPVFSIDAEETIWMTRKVSLEAFSGQDIFVAFRNNSDDKFILFLDDIAVNDSASTVRQDPAILSTDRPDIYANVPLGQVDTFFLSAFVANQGSDPLVDSFSVNSVVFDGLESFPENGIFGQTLEGPVAPLEPAVVANYIGEPAFAPIDTGFHIIAFGISSSEQDSLPLNAFTAETFNNDLDFQTLLVTDTTMAKDDADLRGTFESVWPLPAGEGQRSITGLVFDFINPDVITSATAFLAPVGENLGDELFFQVYDDSLNLVGNSESYTVVAEDTGNVIGITLPFGAGSINKQEGVAGGISMGAGPFILALQGGAYLPTLVNTEIYTPGTNWFSWDSLAMDGRWFTTEDLQATFLDSFQINFPANQVFAIRANVAGCGTIGGELLIETDTTGLGTIVAIPSGGAAPYSYAWSDIAPRPETDSIISGVDPGRYTVVITDNRGCETLLIGVVGGSVSTRDPLEVGISQFALFPNPTEGTLNLSMTLEKPDDISLEILDLRGRTLLFKDLGNTLSRSEQIETSVWTQGMYLLKVQTSQGMLYKRFLVH